MNARLFGLAVLSAVVLSASPSAAQERLPVGTHVGSSAPGSAPGSGAYSEGARRDPFVSLLVSKKTLPPSASRPKAGLAGITLADVAVKGVVLNATGMVAVLEGPGGRSFVGHTKDRLQDATIKVIDSDGVTFTQQVVDALGVVRPRDIRKSLHQAVVEDEK